MAESAVLILNHFRSSELYEQYAQLSRDAGAALDVFLLSDRTQPSFAMRRVPPDLREVRFDVAALVALGYPGKQDIAFDTGRRRSLKLGNAELPVLMFWRQFPEYEHYWVIEHDVRYTGAWHELFDAFADSRADLLGTTLVRYADCPQWQWWRTLALADGDVPRERALRGFFPVYRISARALAGLHEAYVAGCRGHMETLMPTVISLQGLVLEDIGGSGPFVRSGNQERFYTNDPTSESLAPGSFVYRPILEAPGVVPGKLWHPVKTPEPPLLRWVNHALRWGYIAGRQALLSIHRRLQSNVADRRQP